MLIAQLPSWFWLSSAAAFGLALGSFLNVVIYRLPRGMSLASPPSTCPSCGERIRVFDNIPVLGYLRLCGRARCCGSRISPRYPLVELLGGITAAAIVQARILPNPGLAVTQGIVLFVLYLALCLGLLAAAAIDLDHMILPDSITLGGTALGLASALVRPEVSLWESALGAAGGFCLIWLPFVWAHTRVRGYPGMGLGDAKLIALTGAWFGPWGAVFALFAGAVQGTLVTLLVTLLGFRLDEPEAVKREREEFLAELERAEGPEREELQKIMAEDPIMRQADGTLMGARIPFGPFLVLATLELTIFHELIEAWVQEWLWL